MYAQQMQQLNDGGLKEEGGMIDEVSGNDVPIGSTRKEVRDDVPAMLSEGEFVFPADVVRYIGLEDLMKMRQQAKMGLKQMEAMGQMGNSEDATMPDDMPFTEADLIILSGDPEMDKAEMNRGGVVRANQGTFVPNQNAQQTGISGYQQSVFSDRAPINPYQYAPPASAFTGAPAQQPTTTRPVGTSGGQPTGYGPSFIDAGVTRPKPYVSGTDFVQDVFNDVRYINPQTGDIITIRFNAAGDPIDRPEVPAGYIPFSDYTGETTGGGAAAETAPVAATAPVRDDDDDGPDLPPPPPPFNWDEASSEAIVNEVQKLNSNIGGGITVVAMALNPVFGAIVAGAMKLNQKTSLEKLNEKMKDPAFRAQLAKDGQLNILKGEIAKLQEKAEKNSLGIDFLGIITDIGKKIGDALGLPEEKTKQAVKNTVEATAGDETNITVDDNGDVVVLEDDVVVVTDDGITKYKVGDDVVTATEAAEALGFDVSSSFATGDTAADASVVEKAKADRAANFLTINGVTADTISESAFEDIKNSEEALAKLGIDPRTKSYADLQRQNASITTPTTATVDSVVDQTDEVLEVGTGTTSVREETAAALGTGTVDVKTLTSDQIAEVMMGLTDDQLDGMLELSIAGIGPASVLDYVVNGNATGIAAYIKTNPSIKENLPASIIADIEKSDDDDDGGYQPPIFSGTTTQEPAPTVSEIQDYLDSVAEEDEGDSGDDGGYQPPAYTQPSQDPYAEPGRPTGGGDDDGGYQPPAYTQPSQDPYAEPDRPTGGGSDDNDGYTPPAYTQPSQDPYAEPDRPTTPTVTTPTVTTPDTGGYDEAPVTYTPPKKTYTGGGGGKAKGGLIEKPKKKKATPKKRGIAARK